MKTRFRLSRLIIPAVAALLATGCAFNDPKIREHTAWTLDVMPPTTNTPAKLYTNSFVMDRELSAKSSALWPATSELGKQKLSAGKTLSIGTDQLKEDGGGTNTVAALKEINALVDKLPK